MKKKILSIALVLVLTLALVPTTVAESPTVSAGSSPSINFLAGIEPPPADSIPISNRAQLDAIRNNLRGKYHLTNDIDLSDGVWEPIGEGVNVFTDRPFAGTFDGQGFVIRNLTIRQPSDANRASPGHNMRAGLFQLTSYGAVIINVGLENTNIDTATDLLRNTSITIGGIAALNYGRIQNSYVSGIVKGSITPNFPSVLSVGGLVGENFGYIIDCFNAATVSGNGNGETFVAGITGSNRNNASNSAVTASIINCYNIGAVNASTIHENSPVFIGGVVGQNGNNAIVRNSYFLIDSAQVYKDTSLSNAEKKGIGDGMGQATALTSSQMQTQASFNDWDFANVWGFLPGVNNGYPVLRAFHPELQPTSTPAPKPIDNPHSGWAAEELERAAALELIPVSLRNPSVDLTRPITRAEFAGVAVRAYEILSGNTALPAVSNPFTDTRDVDVLKAFNMGLMVGTSATAFAPDSLLTREQCATALTRVFKRSTIPGWTFATDREGLLTFRSPTPFADDRDISSWARESVYFMVANNIIQGVGDNMFAPRAVTPAQQAIGYAVATREQALVIALRMVENLG
jgi:hypothetical protein